MDQFEQLKKKFPKDIARIDNWKKQQKRAMIMLDLRDHQGIQWLVEELHDKVNEINDILLRNEPLTEKDREIVLTDRERCEWFLNIFTGAQAVVDSIELKIKQAYGKGRG